MNGSRFIGLGVAVAVLAVLVLLPALAVVGFYTFANVYAIVTGSDFSSDTMNLAVFLTGLVVTVAAIVVAMAVVAGLIGRALSPRSKDDPSAFEADLGAAGIPEA